MWRMIEPPPLLPAKTAVATSRKRYAPVRWLLMVLAMLSLALGVVGIFVPGLPTVPFILLSAWAASRSSPRLLAWLESHAAFGPMLQEWRLGGVVRRRAKWAATVAMSASGLFMLWSMQKRWLAVALIAVMACVAVWLWLRPENLPVEATPPA